MDERLPPGPAAGRDRGPPDDAPADRPTAEAATDSAATGAIRSARHGVHRPPHAVPIDPSTGHDGRRHDASPAPRPKPPGPAGPTEQPDLKTFLAEHSALLGTVSILTSLSAFVINFHLGWLDLYLKAVLLLAALVVWLEFHARFPEALTKGHLHEVRRLSWRLIAFAYLMRLIMVGFAVWAVWERPLMIVPLIALGAGAVVWHLTAGRGRAHYVLPLLAVVVGFVLSEVAIDAISPEYEAFFEQIRARLERDVGA